MAKGRRRGEATRRQNGQTPLSPCHDSQMPPIARQDSTAVPLGASDERRIRDPQGQIVIAS